MPTITAITTTPCKPTARTTSPPLWTGVIPLPKHLGIAELDVDIQLCIPDTSPPPPPSLIKYLSRTLSSSTLTFGAIIPCECIPLFLVCGPSLPVDTTSPTSADFLRDFFLQCVSPPAPAPSPEDPDAPPDQCPLAMLFSVVPSEDRAQDDFDEDKDRPWIATEIVIYCTITYPPTPERELTPPPSSPTGSQTPPLQAVPQLRLYALPLTSHHGYSSIQPKAEPNVASSNGVYLLKNPMEIVNPPISSAAKKRRLEKLEAAEQRKLGKRPKFNVDGIANVETKRNPPSPPLGLAGRTAINRGLGLAMGGSRVAGKENPRPGSAAARPGSSGGFRRENSLAPYRRDPTLPLPPLKRRESTLPPPMRPGSCALSEARSARPAIAKPRYTDAEMTNRGIAHKFLERELGKFGLSNAPDRSCVKSIMVNDGGRARSVLLEEEEDDDDFDAVCLVGMDTTQREDSVSIMGDYDLIPNDREEYKSVYHHVLKDLAFKFRHTGWRDRVLGKEEVERAVVRIVGVYCDECRVVKREQSVVRREESVFGGAREESVFRREGTTGLGRGERGGTQGVGEELLERIRGDF